MQMNGMTLGKYSIGVGDRFAHQAKAQLAACLSALERGVEVIPVWNKSNREHTIIGSEPMSVRMEADAAVSALGWQLQYFVDADHIGLGTVDRFLSASDFYTIDVADFIGKPAPPSEIDQFTKRHRALCGRVELAEGIEPISITEDDLRLTAHKFLAATKSAGEVYRKLVSARGKGNFVVEISMDETDRAQSPVELLIILAAIADEKIPIQTIAPKFSGRFNKGVDYAGDVAHFEREFVLDIAAIDFATRRFDLPSNLKLSVHSGSDKFSIYPAIHRTMMRFDAGVRLKTAGTTWLEELIGLAESEGSGLEIAKDIYAESFAHREELCAPYSTVIAIDPAALPSPSDVQQWSSGEYMAALRHVPESPSYNSSFRQLLHVGFKVAAKMGNRYLRSLEENESVIARNVTGNLFERHILAVFIGS